VPGRALATAGETGGAPAGSAARAGPATNATANSVVGIRAKFMTPVFAAAAPASTQTRSLYPIPVKRSAIESERTVSTTTMPIESPSGTSLRPVNEYRNASIM